MNIYFYFISYYSVVYIKYTYCFEVPENIPTRYFDGTNWVTVEPRNIGVNPEASKPISISVPLDWEKLSRLIQQTVLETAFDVTTKKPTTKSKTKLTIPITTKRTTSKTTRTIRRLKFITKSVMPPTSRCIYNLCNKIFTESTTKHIKVYQVWKKIWRRPTVEAKYITNPTTPFIPRWIIQEVTSKRTTHKTTKTTTRTTMKPTTRTTMKPTTRTTKTKMTTTPTPTTKQVTKNPGKSNMNMTELPTLPKNWMELMKQFMRALKSVDTTTTLEPSSLKDTTIAPFNFLLTENRKDLTNAEDLINIINDGVEIDDGLIDDIIEENKPSGNSKENENPVMNAELPLTEKLVLTRNVASVKNKNHQPKKKYIYLRDSSLKEYLDEKRTTNENKDDSITQDGEIAAYINVFMKRYVKTENLKSQSQQSMLQYDDVKALLDIIHGKKSLKEILRNSDEQPKNVAIEALFENMEVGNSVPKKISKLNSDTGSARLLKEHRNHWKERDIRKHLNKIKEMYSKSEKVDVQNFIPTKSVIFASSNKFNPNINFNSYDDKKLLVNKDAQSLFSTFVLFLTKNISANAQKVTKPVEEVKDALKPGNTTLELIFQLNQVNPLLTKFRSDPTEIRSQPLLRSIAIDRLPIKYFFTDEDEILNYDEHNDDNERDNTEGIEVDLTDGGLRNMDKIIG